MEKQEIIEKINNLPDSSVRVSDKINASDIKEILKDIVNLLGTGTVTSPEPEDQTNLNDGLIAHWKMDEQSGNTIADLTSNNIGFYNGSLFRQDPPTNKLIGALGFDGSDDFIELNSISITNPLNLYDTDFTIALWIKPVNSGDPYQRILDKSNNSNAKNGYAFYIQSGNLHLMTNGVNTIVATDFCSFNEWQHIVLVCSKDSTDHKLYKNGVPVAIGTKGQVAIPLVETNASIGTWNHSNAREYKGEMADLRIWNRKLTPDEVEKVHLIE